MKIRMHIERLVLDGLDLNPAEAERVKEALVTELTRLLGEDRPALRWPSGARVPRLNVAPLVDPADAPEALGRQAAQRVVGGIAEDP